MMFHSIIGFGRYRCGYGYGYGSEGHPTHDIVINAVCCFGGHLSPATCCSRGHPPHAITRIGAVCCSKSDPSATIKLMVCFCLYKRREHGNVGSMGIAQLPGSYFMCSPKLVGAFMRACCSRGSGGELFVREFNWYRT